MTRHHSTLAETIGPLTVGCARALSARERSELEHWRESRWQELEDRAGRLAERDPAHWYALLVSEGWRERRGTGSLPSWTLDAFYRLKPLLPRRSQLALRKLLIKLKPAGCFPAWPFEPAGWQLIQLAFADELLARGCSSIRFPWFWPGGMTAAATLTHDVESEAGLAHAGEVASWEERYGLRSSFNVVGDCYPIDLGQLHALVRRGHEIGAHGIHHDRSLFASRESFERQLPLLRELAEHLGAVGFRSPATHRVVNWLAELPFAYDCTMSHSDPYEPVPGGTATIWPFFHRDVVELPYTAPQDHTLFNLLEHGDGVLWREQFRRVAACHGLFQALTHPDPEYLGRPTAGRAYRELLQTIAGREDVWFALPREVAAWWRSRRDGETPPDSGLAGWNGSTILLGPAASPDRAHAFADARPLATTGAGLSGPPRSGSGSAHV